ncbi:hypothetical protein BD779DRAFT_514431 [Infundibulicybe gibba]|nr:hypothetical protein BD779DRAFT_514431 [Infundibulicybe gibba]
MLLYFYRNAGYSIAIPLCKNLTSISSWMFLFGGGFSEAMMIIFVWAMWGKTRGLAVFFVVLTIGALIASAIALHSYQDSEIYVTPADLPSNIPGCQVITQGLHGKIYILFLVITIVESVLLSLMFYKAVEHSRGSPSAFVSECVRHGALLVALVHAQ